VTAGASNAAAYFAGVVALMKAADPRLRTRHLIYFAHYGRALKPTSTSQSITTTTGKGTQVKVVEGTRIRRVWTTPTLQELRQQLDKDGK
jgi:hypothetical protein